nr:BspA family leucine-rich repeat surface protein [Mycoplasmopsis bovis]
MLKTLIKTYQIEKPTNVTDMSVTFYNAKKFNSPLNNWDTSNVKICNQCFMAHAEFNQVIIKLKNKQCYKYVIYVRMEHAKFDKNISWQWLCQKSY